MVGSIHIKKYLANIKINGEQEEWISLIKKMTKTAKEGEEFVAYEPTADDLALLEVCKKKTKEYLDTKASDKLRDSVGADNEDLVNMKRAASSMKYKFSKLAYEVVTHVVNLMIREILTYTCDNCASKENKLTKVTHIPWNDLQSKLLAGLYMNTKAVFDVLHPTEDTTPVVEEEEAVEETTEDEESADEPVVKVAKPRLSQYISNTFKEIISRDDRFKGLLLGKEVTSLVNDIIYQVLDRYSNIIMSLLKATESKTVTGSIAFITTEILLRDHIYSDDSQVAVIHDVVEARLNELVGTEDEEDDEDETTEEPVVEEPKKKVAKKAAK
jgi:NAD-dependent SIR2 family protein deacetylase